MFSSDSAADHRIGVSSETTTESTPLGHSGGGGGEGRKMDPASDNPCCEALPRIRRDGFKVYEGIFHRSLFGTEMWLTSPGLRVDDEALPVVITGLVSSISLRCVLYKLNEKWEMTRMMNMVWLLCR